MKKVFSKLLWVTLLAGLTAGCSSDENSNSDENQDYLIIDYGPLVISVKVLSPEGYSILNAQNTQDISAVFRGNSYECQSVEKATRYPEPATRYYLPCFYGLIYQTDYLLFGELDGAKNYENEELILYWGGDLKPDTITFSHIIHSVDNNQKLPEIENQCLLNGLPVTGQIIIYKDLTTQAAEQNDSTPRKQMPISREQFALIKQVNTFGTNLFREIVKKKQTESTVASPLSVAYLLGMIANGAPENSQSAQQLLHVLNGENGANKNLITGLTPEFNNLFQTLITWAPQVDNRVKLEIADALFTDNNFPVYAGFVDMLAQYYQADYAKLDFRSSEAVKTINDWSSQKTHGLIPSIIDKIPPTTVAYLLNAIYFKAPWAVAFPQEYTRQQDFTLPDGSKQLKYLMHNQLEALVAQEDNYIAVSLPFAKGAYWMDIVLPAEGISTAQLAQELDFQNIRWQNADVMLTLPRFEVCSEHKDLKSLLQTLGVQSIFTPSAGFTELSPVTDLHISNVFQKARIIINEKGGEAAAITGGEATTTSLPKELTFTADRPFLYCIREQSSGAIFFIGTYCGNEE